MLSSSRWWLAVLLACCPLTACFAPSDPEPVPVGLRLDGGVLTAYVPLCPGERVTAAHIDEPQGNGKQLWHGEDPAHPEAKLMRLGGSDWKRQAGSFKYVGQEFTVDVDTTGLTYSGGSGGRQNLSEVPTGQFDLDGKHLTTAELDAEARCAKSG